MKLHKQTVYLPINNKINEAYLVKRDFFDFIKEQQGYLLTPEQLNEYTQKVIKQALETAAEKAEITNKPKFSGDYNPVVDEESITNTFEETFKKFEV